jgi:hypothetical protein
MICPICGKHAIYKATSRSVVKLMINGTVINVHNKCRNDVIRKWIEGSVINATSSKQSGNKD